MRRRWIFLVLFIAVFFAAFRLSNVSLSNSWGTVDGKINGAWLYRVPIIVSERSGSTLTDYQVRLVVNTAILISDGKMNPDCSDMRFSWLNPDTGAEEYIPYWIEGGCGTYSTVVWVKVPSIPANEATTIYMYYGNPSATSESDIRSVGEPGSDDFRGLTITWEPEPTTNGTISYYPLPTGSGSEAAMYYYASGQKCGIYGDGKFSMLDPGTADYQYNLYHTPLVSAPFAIDIHFISVGGTGDYGAPVIALADSSDSSLLQLLIGEATSVSVDSRDLTDAKITFTYDGGTMKAYINGVLKKTATSTEGSARLYMRVGEYFNDQTEYAYFDWVFVHKYVSPEPTATFGSEEELEIFHVSVTHSPADLLSLTLDPDRGVTDVKVTYTASIDNPSSFSVVSWKWTENGDVIDEGTGEPPLTLTRTYTEAGDYNVCLYVVTAVGSSAEGCDTVRVERGWWLYRLPITIKEQSGATLTNYQVRLTVDTRTLVAQSKMRADCSDIRFTDANGNQIPYWIESGCDTSSTIVWVKVPSIPADGNTTIYMYYGNPIAVSGSNGDAVFEFFDDFDGTTLDAAKWTVGSGGVGVVDGQVSVWYNGASGKVYSNVKFAPPVVVDFLADYGGVSSVAFGWRNEPTSYIPEVILYNADNGTTLYSNAGTAATYTISTDLAREIRASLVWTAEQVSAVVSGSVSGSGSVTSDIPVVWLPIAFVNGSSTAAYLDWIAVRKYASVEPVFTFGSEEDISPPSESETGGDVGTGEEVGTGGESESEVSGGIVGGTSTEGEGVSSGSGTTSSVQVSVQSASPVVGGSGVPSYVVVGVVAILGVLAYVFLLKR